MHAIVTVKLQPETDEELANTFPSQIKLAREHFEALRKESVFGHPDKVTFRYILIMAPAGVIAVDESQPAAEDTVIVEES